MENQVRYRKCTIWDTVNHETLYRNNRRFPATILGLNSLETFPLRKHALLDALLIVLDCCILALGRV